MRLMGVDMQRSSTAIRHGDSLSLISPTDSIDYVSIHRLGEVKHVLAPTYFHDTGMRTAAKQIPGATLWGVPNLAKVLSELELQPLSTTHLPDEWADHLECIPIAGMPGVSEQVFWHPNSGTLIISDLIFNICPPADWWTRLFFKINGVWEHPGPTRIFRSFIKDKPAFRNSIQKSKALPIRCILPAHGKPIVEPGTITETLQRLDDL